MNISCLVFSLNRFDKSISLQVKNKERSSRQLQFLFTRAYFMSFRTVYLLLTFIYWFSLPVAIDEAREELNFDSILETRIVATRLNASN
jgi:hypothetical protein